MSYKSHPKYTEETAAHGKQEPTSSVKLCPAVFHNDEFRKIRDIVCFGYRPCKLPSLASIMHVKMLLMALW